MATIKRIALILSNIVVTAALVALLGGAAWGAWRLLPEASRTALTDPGTTLDAARRGVRTGPANPITSFIDWVLEWLGEQRDRVDAVFAADGTDGGIVPLAAWMPVDGQRVIGATETLWQPRRAKLSGAQWSRVVFSWADIQPRSAREWRAGYYLRDNIIRKERANGIELVGLLMNTPPWAAARPQDGPRSVPAGLYLPVDDPQNVWATFVRRMAAEYRGRIDTWIIWNEQDIRPGGPNAHYMTWAGDARDYAQLIKVAYLAAKQGNAKARVLFGATTYWSDVNAGEPLFLERTLAALDDDPEAARHGYFFDAVALNLYSSPDDLRRIAGVYRDVLGRNGLDTPLWLTETNAMPYDDPMKGLRREQNGMRVTLDQQASFVVQALALGLSAGYERIAIHSMTDRDTQDELWGLIRNDGSLRPSFVAYQTAARYLGGAQRAVFAPRERAGWRWARDGYVPNWEIYLVVVERSAGAPAPPSPPAATGTPTAAAVAAGAAHDGSAAHPQRVSVLWNGDPVERVVSLPRNSARAALVDKYGRVQPLEADGERWLIKLGPATAQSPLDPEGYYFIGGDPVLLVEESVPADAPVVAPEPMS
ncbi:MAG: hypothetical protein HY332_25895 [Chloroflexi bacterium]|nr:hypothetical protein [Chloroflexota bacterium]